MSELGTTFRTWITGRTVEGFELEQVDNDTFVLNGADVFAAITFYTLDPDQPEIVELRIERRDTGDNVFYLHFELEDLSHAQELFDEMLEALGASNKDDTVHVLLCCTAGMTTSMFAAKMNEVAQGLNIAYEFSAVPLEQAKQDGHDYAAVLLAPQVGHRRSELAEAVPEALVIPFPTQIFATYDAAGAVRLVMDALEGQTAAQEASDKDDFRLARHIDDDKHALILSVIHEENRTEINWRIQCLGVIHHEGTVVKRRFSYRDVEDVVSTVALKGVKVQNANVIAIALPGVVQGGSVEMRSMNTGVVNLGDDIEKRWCVPVVMENNARAAAVGAYMSQTEHESVVFHTQRVGHWVGGQGAIVDGHLVHGFSSYAGELSALARRFGPEQEGRDDAWTSEGMCKLVADYLTASVSMLAPEVVYVACDLLPSMDELRDEMLRYIPEDVMPKLVQVHNYRELTLLGIHALALSRLERR